MKTKLPALKTIILFLFLNIAIQGFSTAFTAVSSGDWSNSATWGGTAPSFNNSADQVIIPSGITVTLDNDLVINGTTSLLTVNGVLISSSNTSLTSTYGTINGTGTINIGNAIFGTGTILSFAGNFTTNTLYSATQDLQVTANFLVHQTLTLASGTMKLNSGSTLALSDNATIVITAGQLVTNGGSAVLSSSYSVVYNSGATVTGVELTGSGLTNVTVNVGSGNTLTLGTDLSVKGLLTLSSGTLSLGISNLTLKGDLSASGSGNVKSTPASDITISSGVSMAGTLSFTGASSVKQLTINTGANLESKISGDLTVTGTLDLVAGTLVLNSGTFHIAGDISSTSSGNISTTTTSSITISNQGAINGTLYFLAGSHVNNFTMIAGNAVVLNIGSDFTIDGNLILTSGKINIGSHKLYVTGSVSGGNTNSYIITAVSGALAMNVSSTAAVRFHTGTPTAYYPAEISVSSGSASGRFDVAVNDNVYSGGINTGTDLSLTKPLVDATWFVSTSVSANLNISLKLMWLPSAEANGFMNTACYISHYTNGSWDKISPSSASASGGLFSVTRANITSLSPFAVFDENTNPTGINSIAGKSFSAYPNPCSNILWLDGIKENEGELHADIYNLNGMLISSSVLNAEKPMIRTSELSEGAYMVKIHNENSGRILKFVKM
jgi:hypothetical protein